MDSRIFEESTPEGRIAAAARLIATKMIDAFPDRHPMFQYPDYADLREGLRPYIQREILFAKLEELHRWKGLGHLYKAHREKELIAKLAKLDRFIEELVSKK